MAIDEVHPPPSEAETAITLFCWWETVSTAPHIVRHVLLPFVPNSVVLWAKSSRLYHQVPSFDSWVMIPFTVLTFAWVVSFLWRRKRRLSESSADISVTTADDLAAMYGNYRLAKFLRHLRSLFLLTIREALLNRMGVHIYGTFEHPDYWPPEPGLKSSIDRFYFKSKNTREYRYSDEYQFLVVRDADETGNFLNPIKRAPSSEDIRLLLIGSNYFWRWFPIYLWKKLISENRTESAR